MKKLYFTLATAVAVLCLSLGVKAAGWPANYQGVMLQGFYWDSYKGSNDTKWTTLTSKADELSQYFKLIWVPNSARANGENGGGNGYMPIYWFTNHNCAYGTEAQLKTMISTFKAKGVGIIEDVVVNHRVGSSNWYNFPTETWNGRTYQLTNGAICSTDEMWKSGGQGCPYTKGAPDTGEDFDGARDLDHTNATVQDHVKNYCKFLIDDMGYVGFRLDMVKGYGGQYTKIYNQYSKPQFSVGEYFDGSYDKVAAWIDATGKESAAFDFPLKYQLNKAFPSANSYNLTELCWKNPSGENQPAGMIHYGYTQYSVTFVDNHDTYRDGSKFNGNVVAANAFILCSPGTPCVFYPHYTQYKSQIQALIKVRNDVGVHNLSPVKVLKCESNCYMAEVTGTKGKLVVKIGNTMDSPSGYSNSDIKCSGDGYCVWSTTDGGVTPDIPSKEAFKVYFKNTVNWTTPYIHYWGSTESSWPGVAMSKVSGTSDIWTYTVPAGTTGCLFNAGDGDPTKTADFSAQPNHLYTTSGDQGVYSGSGDVEQPKPGNYPSTLYLIGNIMDSEWSTEKGYEAKGTNGVYKFSNVKIDDSGNGSGYFAFATKLGANWDVVNSGDRYGAGASDTPIAAGKSDNIVLYAANVNASGSQSWMINAGNYDITADLSSMKLTVATVGSTVDPTPDPDPETYPAKLYMLGNVNGTDWATDKGVEAVGNKGVYTWNDVTIDNGNQGKGYFAFVTVLGANWDEVNGAHRYGAPTENTPLAKGGNAAIRLYEAGVDASSSQSWEVDADTYTVRADLPNMKVYLMEGTGAGIEDFINDDTPAVFFNLQGQKVENPEKGVYIMVKGKKAVKVIL